MKINKTIYIPIEIKARELNSQILLANKIAENGGRVYIGTKSGINEIIKRKRSEGGILLYKGGMGEIEVLKIKKKIDVVAVMDQEISPILMDLSMIERRYSDQELNLIDRFYYVGNKFACYHLEKKPNLTREKVKVYGWPRIDLWTQKYRKIWVDESIILKQKYGKFILFSSDFGAMDDYDVDWRVKQEKNWRNYDGNDNKILAFEKKLKNNVLEFKKFIKFLSQIDECVDVPTIIIRPHPAEDHKKWSNVVKNFRRVKVVFEKDITPWILSSVAVLHRGCTSSLQAFVMNKPVIYIALGYNESPSIASKVSQKINNANELLRAIDEYKKPENLDINELIADCDGNSVEGIAKDLMSLQAKGEYPFGYKSCFEIIAAKFRVILRKKLFFTRSIIYSKIKGIPYDVIANKIPDGIKLNEINYILNKIKSERITSIEVIGDVFKIEQL